MIDMVNNPKHYKLKQKVEVECIDITRHLSFNRGNAFKYIWRAGKKGGLDKALEDLSKALWYVSDTHSWTIFQDDKKPVAAAVAVFNLLPKRDDSDVLYKDRYSALEGIVYHFCDCDVLIRRFIKAVNRICKRYGWDHPDVVILDYADIMAKEARMSKANEGVVRWQAMYQIIESLNIAEYDVENVLGDYEAPSKEWVASVFDAVACNLRQWYKLGLIPEPRVDGFQGNRYIHFHNSDIDKVVDRQVMTDAEEQKGEQK